MTSPRVAKLDPWPQHERLSKNRELPPLFKVALAMLVSRPDNRPAVGELVRDIAAIGEDQSYETC